MSPMTHTVVRLATPDDADALAAVCLLTARSGEDATGLLSDDSLWADLYALPYLALEPDLTFVVQDAEGVAGYVLGTSDSSAFADAFRRRWLPVAGPRHPQGPRDLPLEARLVSDLHQPERDLPAEVAQYPAHLHIDLLPRAQGRGLGRALMTTFFRAVRAAGAPGVHLQISPDNHRAHAFYSHLGMTEVRPASGGVFFVAATDLL